MNLPDMSWVSFLILFVKQMAIGLVAGYLLGKVITWTINHANLGYDGLYPVLALSFVPLIYSGTDFRCDIRSHSGKTIPIILKLLHVGGYRSA